MAEISSWNYSGDGLFSNVVGAGEGIFFSSKADTVAALDVGSYPDYTLIARLDLSDVIGEANNVKYVSPTSVSLNGGPAVALTPGNVAQQDCSFRIDWEDDAGNTTLSNVQLIAHDPGNLATAPSGVRVVAFERTAAAIRKSHDEGMADGNAWDDSSGIGGSANSLDMENQALAAVHSFYIGLSMRPTSVGKHRNVRLTLSFDVT